MELYRCIKEFSVAKYDDDGWLIENEQYDVTIGEIYSIAENRFRIVGGPDSIHLDREDKGKYGWLEIDRDTFIEHFEKVED